MQKGKAVVVNGCVFVLMVIWIGGCATVPSISCFQSNVDSLAATDADLRDKTYVLSSAMKNISDDDLEFKAIAKYVNNALIQKGYKQVDSKKNASLLIRLAYGEGDTQTTTSTYTSAPGFSYPIGYYRYYVPPATQTVTSTTFNAHLVLEAYDLKNMRKLPQIWKTTMKVSNADADSFSNRRMVYVDMIAASIDYIGTNVGQKRVIVCDDPAGIALIDGLME